MNEANGGMPTGELVRRLSEDASRLFRAELQLARLEVTQSLNKAKQGTGMFGGAAAAAFYGAGVLVAAVVLALALVLPDWAAALVVGGVLLAVAALLALLGRRRLHQAAPPVPRAVVAGVRRDIETIKEGMHSERQTGSAPSGAPRRRQGGPDAGDDRRGTA